MKRIVLFAAGLALVWPGGATAANPGSEATSDCGAYHGMFATPAHGFLRDWVPGFATSGVYKGGFVGDYASSPACHSRDDG
ncbi:MAG: hypothetical protein ACR2G3_08815 [Solirubrobacterales bacterium]